MKTVTHKAEPNPIIAAVWPLLPEGLTMETQHGWKITRFWEVTIRIRVMPEKNPHHSVANFAWRENFFNLKHRFADRTPLYLRIAREAIRTARREGWV